MSNSIAIVGAPISTFTRTMRMALRHLKLEYDFQIGAPYSELAYKHNPFGRIPSLIHKNQTIFETSAIRDYVDSTFNSSLTPKDLSTRIRVDQIISILSDYIFHQVIYGILKPRTSYEEEGKSENEIKKLLSEGVEKGRKILATLDQIVDENGPFLCGKELTWADYFVYPAIADLFALPEGEALREKAPRLTRWHKGFEQREEVIYTYPDTVADQRSKL